MAFLPAGKLWLAPLVLGLAVSLLSGCGQNLGRIELAGRPVPKAVAEVAIGQVVQLPQVDSQTATYSGASMSDYRRHVRQLTGDGWRFISESNTVASLSTTLAKDDARLTVGWSAAGGLIVNVQVNRPEVSPTPATGDPSI
jgi:hypothetical protein